MKQQSKRVNVPDIRDLIEFWEMKDLIGFQLRNYLFTLNAMRHESQVNAICDLLDKIESIGKKEGE